MQNTQTSYDKGTFVQLTGTVQLHSLTQLKKEKMRVNLFRNMKWKRIVTVNI